MKLGIPMSHLAVDQGYETGAVHRGLELLGMTGYISAIRFSNPSERYRLSYDPQQAMFICPDGIPLIIGRIATNPPAIICAVTRWMVTVVCVVRNGQIALTKLVSDVGFWPVAAIRHFAEGTSV